MNNIEHYKSLISDEEVIKALVKESKAREGELLKGKTRVRPNLNFFQRTVTNLVSSNKRVRTTKELVDKESDKYVNKIQSKTKTHSLTKVIVPSNKISSGLGKDLLGDDNSSEQPINCVKRTDTTNTDSYVEKSYKEGLSKYFVSASDNNTTSRKRMRPQKCMPLLNNSVKSKSIVFNLNFSKDKLVKSATTTENVSGSETQSTSVAEPCNNDVISISSSSSSSSSCESSIIDLLESDSD